MTLIASKEVHAAESTHWYTADGRPMYEVMAKNGKPRPATLRDARKLNLRPGVSTITNCMAKPGLDAWKQKQVLLAALTLPKIDGETEDAYIARIMADSKEQGKKAAERGTSIHESIEKFYTDRSWNDEHGPYVYGTAEKIRAIFGQQQWLAEKTFAAPLGYGGKTDLACPDIVLDVKTKEFDADHLPDAFDEHVIQLAAYRVGLQMPRAQCANVFVSANNPGLVHVVIHDEEALVRGMKMFIGLLDYWYAKTGLAR